MKKILFSILVFVPLFALGAPMTNDDVIKMVKGGLGDATVLQAIDGAEPGFDTSPDGLVKLKQGGVSEAVIQRILGGRGVAPPRIASPLTCVDCGTVAGHMIEKNAREGHSFEIGVRFDDGHFRIFTQETHPSLNQGSRVRLVNGALAPL